MTIASQRLIKRLPEKPITRRNLRGAPCGVGFECFAQPLQRKNALMTSTKYIGMALRGLRQEVRRDLLAESKKHQAWRRLCQIPSIGPIRAAVLLGILQTPHRFRAKRPLRFGHRDAQQCRSPFGQRTAAATNSIQTTTGAAQWPSGGQAPSQALATRLWQRRGLKIPAEAH
jgi:hypothetical protein